MTILDQDIEMYLSFAENHARDLRNCRPDAEARHKAMRDSARAAVAALVAYRAVLEQLEDRSV